MWITPMSEMPPIWWSDSENGWVLKQPHNGLYDLVRIGNVCADIDEELSELPEDAEPLERAATLYDLHTQLYILKDKRKVRRIAYAGGIMRVRGELERTGDRCDDLDCLICGSRETAVYRCSSCEQKWEFPGEYQYYWQGHGHFHHADDEAWGDTIIDHVNTHEPHAVAFPEYPDDPLSRATRSAINILRDAGFDQPELTERMVRILATDLGFFDPVAGEKNEHSVDTTTS